MEMKSKVRNVQQLFPLLVVFALGVAVGRTSFVTEFGGLNRERVKGEQRTFSGIEQLVRQFQSNFHADYSGLRLALLDEKPFGPERVLTGASGVSPSTAVVAWAAGDARLASSMVEEALLAMMEDLRGALRGSHPLHLVERDLLQFYKRGGREEEFVRLYEEILQVQTSHPGLEQYADVYRDLKQRFQQRNVRGA